MRTPTPVKKVGKALMWIATYELWRLNAKVTAFAIRRIRAQKTDENTWCEAISDARDILREEVHNGTRE
jgi:hypothetical protein